MKLFSTVKKAEMSVQNPHLRIVLLFSGCILLVMLAGCHRGILQNNQTLSSDLMVQANQHYESGEYQPAALLYESLISQGVSNGAVRFGSDIRRSDKNNKNQGVLSLADTIGAVDAETIHFLQDRCDGPRPPRGSHFWSVDFLSIKGAADTAGCHAVTTRPG